MWRIALCCFTAATARAECRLGRIAELPIQSSQGELIVGGRIDGQPARFVFDTGSGTTVINSASVQRLELRSVRPDHGVGALARLEGIGGNVSAHAVEAQSIDLGGLRARNFAFVAAALPLFSDSRNPPDGLLSSDLLAKYDIDLDLHGGSVRLFYPLTDCSHPAAYMHGPLYMTPLLPGSDERSPRIAIQVAGTTLTAVLDTGAPTSMVFAPASRAFRPATAAQIRLRGVAGRDVTAIRTTLPTVAIGDLEFDHLPVALSSDALGDADHPVDAILGLDFMRTVHLWLSFSSRTLIMQFPPS